MRTSLDQVLEEARSLIGTTRRYGENDNQFTRWHGHPGWAWCNIFLDYVLFTACHRNGERSPLEGIDFPQGPAYTGDTMTAAERGENGLGWNTGQPRIGQLAIYDWDWAGLTDHIGLVAAIPNPNDPNGFYSIEGNTGNPEDVYQVFRRNDRGYVRGFVTVPYGAAVTPPAPPPVAAPPFPGLTLALTSPLLGYPSSWAGAEVTLWQRRMSNRGWTIGVDGVYGLQSEGVCRKFQQEKHLTVDGQVGPVTWRASWEDPVTAQ